MVKNLSFNAGEIRVLIGELKPPCASGQLSQPTPRPVTTTREKPVHFNERSHMLQLKPDAAK